jgi:hypothetical protein
MLFKKILYNAEEIGNFKRNLDCLINYQIQRMRRT